MAARSRKDISKRFPGLEMNRLEAIRMTHIGKPHPLNKHLLLVRSFHPLAPRLSRPNTIKALDDGYLVMLYLAAREIQAAHRNP